MPASQLTLYAGWRKITHTIDIYDSEENLGNADRLVKTITVPYDELADANDRPDDPTSTEDKTFIGWYYIDEANEEQRFDFATMTITQNMRIYAKWRSNVMKKVEIHYEVEDENGNRTQIADTETLMLRLSQTRTFEAKTGNSLYVDYRTGYFPLTASHSITITDAHIESTDPVIYTFVYKNYGTVPYRVKFTVMELDGTTTRPAFKKNADGTPEFVEAWDNSYTEYYEEHWLNDKAAVVELFEPDVLADEGWELLDAYLPNALKIQKVIVPSENDPENNIEANTIEFIYAHTEPVVDPDNPVDPDDPDNPDTPAVYKAKYLVQHYIQNISDPNKYDLYRFVNEEGLSGKTATAEAITIPGYTYSEEFTAKYKGNNVLTDNVLSGTITADDSLELNFYYTVNSYPYRVMYLEEGSNMQLAETKTTGSDGKLLTGFYGSNVTEYAITIEGYDVVDDDGKQSIEIRMEAGDTASVNTIVFYYKQKSAELVLSKAVQLDATQAAQEGISELPSWVYDQEFEFEIYQPQGFPKSVYHYTYTDSNNTSEERSIGAGVQTINISLKPGEKVQFHDIPMGTYTVTETYVPGFKATVDGYIAQAHSITLDTDGEVGTLNFVNTFPFYTGDLVIKKDVTKADENDPSATKPYKVTVEINPDTAAREVDRVITFVDQDGNAVTDANGNNSFTIPKLTGTGDQTSFSVQVLVPVDGEVKLKDVPVGSFTATEEVQGTIGYIYDFFTVKYNKALHENDEVTGTNHVVSGSIHGGHPTAVTFHNTYKKGDLTINKTVSQEYVNDNWESDTFTFTINGTTELPDGAYHITDDGVPSTVAVTDGKITLTKEISIFKTEDETSWSDSFAYENLPAGYYTVTETAGLGNDKYNAIVVSDPDTGLVNDTDMPAEFNFTNTYKRTTGSLKVSKEIVIVTDGSVIDTNQDFTFVIELKDGTLTGPYNYTVKTINATADVTADTVIRTGELSAEEVEDQTILTFSLKHNQYIVIEGLPVGSYLVKEESVEGYDSSFGDVITNPGKYSVDPAIITTDSLTELNCQNAYPVYYSHLVVKKTVETPEGNSAIDIAPMDDIFTFTVKMSDYSDKITIDGGISARFYDSKDDTTPNEQSLIPVDNIITFTLKAGQWVDINIPACTYIITETGLSSTVNTDVLADHYTTAYKIGDTKGVVGDSYTIVSGERENVEFINTYKQHYGNLTITKTNAADNSQVFVYEVKNTQNTENESIYVTVTGNESVTISDLPFGLYTITQVNDWSWRYTDEAKVGFDFNTENNKATFSDGISKYKTLWLNANSTVLTNTYNKKDEETP